jgi:large subunit ribosomal protein L49
MPRIQQLMPLLRPAIAPRAALRFSTATRRAAPTASPPSHTSPAAPTSPQAASRAADLAAAEAITESDSAQPPSRKPSDVFPPSSQSKKTPTSPALDLPPPRYHVARTPNRNLPIYTDFKRGGNLHLTTVRHITGEATALRDELRVFLNKKSEDVKVNGLTGHVVVKGHCVAAVKGFLEGRGM